MYAVPSTDTHMLYHIHTHKLVHLRYTYVIYRHISCTIYRYMYVSHCPQLPCSYASALPYLVCACEMNDVLTSRGHVMRGLDHRLLYSYRRQCVLVSCPEWCSLHWRRGSINSEPHQRGSENGFAPTVITKSAILYFVKRLLNLFINRIPNVIIYSKTSLYRPTTGPTLYGPFREVVGLGS